MLPKAMDGTRVESCADASCEVEVASGDVIPLASGYGIHRFSIESIKDHLITWRATYTGGSSTAVLGGQRSDVSCSNGECIGHLAGSGGTLRINSITAHFLTISADRAVVRFSPAKN